MVRAETVPVTVHRHVRSQVCLLPAAEGCPDTTCSGARRAFVVATAVLIAAGVVLGLVDTPHRSAAALKAGGVVLAAGSSASASPTPTGTRLPQMWRPRPNNDDIVLVLAHYNEDTSWTARQPYDYVVKSQCCLELGTSVDGWNTQLGYQRGTEPPAYLSFIIENYDNLPKHMVFMHAHDGSWHQIVSGRPSGIKPSV